MGKIILSLATFGSLGNFPASGTLGAIVALPCAYFLSHISFPLNFSILFLIVAFALFVIDRALPYFAASDPGQIIIDEFVGMLVTMISMSYKPITFIVGFLLFRLFDIFKPCGIHYVEKLPGAYGVLFDDVLAGLCANIILRFLFV